MIFLFVKTIEKEIRLFTVLNFFFFLFSASFEDMAIFHGIQLSFDKGGRALQCPLQIDR